MKVYYIAGDRVLEEASAQDLPRKKAHIVKQLIQVMLGCSNIMEPATKPHQPLAPRKTDYIGAKSMQFLGNLAII
jgi:hypothetical protein